MKGRVTKNLLFHLTSLKNIITKKKEIKMDKSITDKVIIWLKIFQKIIVYEGVSKV